MVLDQGLSTASNGVFGIAAANLLTIRQVGLLAIAASIYGMVVLFSRAVLLDPYLIDKGRGVDHAHDLIQRRAFILGLIAGLLIASSAMFWGGENGRVILILGAALPFLCLQDAARYTALASSSPRQAAAMDGVWVAGAMMGWVCISVGIIEPTPGVLLAGWAVIGAVSSLLLLNPTRLVGRMDSRGWGHQVISISGPLLTELLLGSLLVLVIPVELSLLANLDEAGFYRTVMTLQGPIGALAAGLVLAHRANSARLMRERSPFARGVVARVTATVAIASVFWTIAAVALPTHVGSRVFGEVWSGIDLLFLPAGLQVIAGALTTPLAMMLSAEVGFGRSYLRLRLLAGAILVAAVAIGATQAGAKGALIGQGFANLLWSGLLWRAFSRRLSCPGPSQPTRPIPT